MKKILLTLAAAGLLLSAQQVQAKVSHLLPRPQQVTVQTGSFALGGTVSITDPTNCEALQRFFTSSGCTLGTGGKAVTVTLVESISGAYDYPLAGFENEAYTLEVTATAINITAVTATGVIRAAQTLTQLAEGYDGTAALEAVNITDWPAFKLRGYTHDVGRSFITVAELKKHIDLLSRFKVNTFHWHLTENQAWRMEIKAYPQLTSAESMTRFAGLFYTQDDCREVAAYAKERGVVIIPEIDMPGHSAAFERAMGHGMQTDQGVEELKKILDEVAVVFADAPYIHIGADEQTITYPNFLKIMTDYVHGKGKKVVVWNPIRGVNVADVDCDMTQMWSTSGRKIDGRPNIDCRYNYVNHFDVFADVVGIYKSSIYYADKGNAEIAGSLSAYWNDRKTPTQEDIVKQNNMYAAVLATAERCWIGGGKAYIETGGTTLPNSGEEYDEFANWESRFLFHKANSLKDEPIPYVKQTNVRWRITDPVPNGGNADAVFAPEEQGKSTSTELMPESFTHEGKTYSSGMATGAGIYLRHTWGNGTVPTYFGKTDYSNVTSYAWTYVYSPVQQTVGAQIEFHNYGRSENDKAPDAGKWDRKGSDIWLNGERINPPTWDNSGKGIGAEVDLMNENFTARKPIEVPLKQGWNKVFLKLPYVSANGVRLNKWMFTCVFTDTEGKNAVEGLIYSPNQCMDEAAEKVAAEVSAKKRDMNNYVGTAVGLWPESVAADLKAKIAEIEATYDDATMTGEQRDAQVAALTTAYTAFLAALTPETMNQPAEGKYYRMSTPLRGNRFPTSKGIGAAIVGEQNPADNTSVWKFVVRTDGSYDIQNFHDLSFISPNSTKPNALKTSAARPASGWTIKAADTKGYVIVTSGTAQFNQANNGAYNLLNWGDGTNTNDAGCQYAFVEVTVDPADEGAGVPTEPEALPFQTTTIVNGEFAKGTVWYTMQLGESQTIIADNGTANHIALNRATTSLEVGDLWCFVGNKTDGFKIYNKNTGTSKVLASPAVTEKGGSTYPTMQDAAALPTGYTGAWDILSSDKIEGVDGYYLLLHGTDYAVNNFGGNGKLAFWTDGKDKNSTISFTFAEAELEIKQATGEFTASNPAKTWHSTWESNQLPGFTWGVGANNMTTADGYVSVYSGQTESCTHTLTAPESCVVAGYSFDFVNTTTESYTINLNVAGTAYRSSGTKQSVKVNGLKDRTATYAQSGANKGVTFSNYYVTVRRSMREPEPQFEVFSTPTTAAIPYRIPAIATAYNGNIIAVADYRTSRADIGSVGSGDGKIDLHYRVSTDNGKTWSNVLTLVEGKGHTWANENNNPMYAGFGDPCIVADRESNRVMVLSCSGKVTFPAGTRNNHQGIARFYSDDNGLTWGEPTDISERIYAQFDNRDMGPVQSMFVGSGKISQSNIVKVGDYYRIYCAVLAKQNSGPWVNYVLYSDDFGENWSVLGGVDVSPIPSGGDEPKADELPDGSVVISSRNGGGRNVNIYTFSDIKTGKGSWGTMGESRQSNNGTVGVSCNGEIMFVPVVRKSDSQKMYLALQSVPVGPGRTNVSIYYKGLENPAAYASPSIFAANWEGRHQASYMGSAYSTMCLQADNHIGFLYEEETNCPVSGGGYTILYKNYSVEQITDSLYTFDETPDREAFAFPTDALDARWADAQMMVGENVGNITEADFAPVQTAYNAYKADPSQETYEGFAAAIEEVGENAEQIGINAGIMYRLCNSDRKNAENRPYYMVANAEGLTAALFDESAQNQLFAFVPTDTEGVYYVKNEAANVFIGQTGANETKIPVVSTTGDTNKYRIASDVYGRSSLSCTTPGGPNPAIHLAGDCSRLVPWVAQGSPASQWYIEPTDLATVIESAPAHSDESVSAAIYDLSGRRVLRPAAGVYIRNGKKYIKK